MVDFTDEQIDLLIKVVNEGWEINITPESFKRELAYHVKRDRDNEITALALDYLSSKDKIEAADSEKTIRDTPRCKRCFDDAAAVAFTEAIRPRFAAAVTAANLAEAAEMLRAAGWRVVPPPCPECEDRGFIMTGGSFPGGGWAGNAPCPKGCPPPTLRT